MSVIDYQKHSDQKLLFKAAADNDFQTIADLVAKGHIDINAKNKNGRTPLILAMENNNSEAALMLIHHKADITAILPSRNLQPLAIACAKGMTEVIERLVTVGAPLDTQVPLDGETALMKAIQRGDGWAACRLAGAGADTDTIANSNGKTAWHLAHEYLEAEDYNFFKGIVEKQRLQRAENTARELAENVRDATVLQRDIKPLKRLTLRHKG